MSEKEIPGNSDATRLSEMESDRALMKQLADALEKEKEKVRSYEFRLAEAHLAYKLLRGKLPVRLMFKAKSLADGARERLRSLKRLIIKEIPHADLKPLQGSAIPPNLAEEIVQFAATDLVSIITPTYNRGYVIEKAIESVMNQTYPHWELIITDDGSTDDTDRALEKYLDDERVVVVHKKHGGVSSARNAGVRLAHGEYVAFLDSDDIWDKDFLKVMLYHMKREDERCGMLYCDHILYDDKSEVLRKRHDPFSYGRIREEPVIDLCTVMARRKAMLDIGLFDESMTKLVDYELFLRMADKYEIKHVPHFLLHYFRLSDGISVTPDREIGGDHNEDVILKTKANTLKIAYVLWDYPAVSQSFVLSEIKWLTNRGYDVNVYHKTEPDLKAEVEYDVPTYRVKEVQDLVKLLREHKRNILHSHFAYPVTTLLTHPAATEAEIPFTFNPHAVDIFHKDNIGRNRVGLVSQSQWCKGVVALGQYHRDFLVDRGVPPEIIFIKPAASNLRRFLNKDREPPPRIANIVSICRFVEKKGMEYLVKAGGLLTDLPITINIYGYGPEEKRLRAFAGKSENVKFHGPPRSPEEVRKILSSADLFVLPSVETDMGDKDGIPTSLMEAMASGVPVIATDVSSIPDLVSDMETGFVAAERDAGNLAHTIRKVCNMPADELKEIIRAAHIRIEDDFDPDRLNRRLVRAWLK